MKRKISWPLTMLLVGAGVMLVGELKGATSVERGDTLSEQFYNLPTWAQMFGCFLIGCVFSHLARWQVTAPSTIEVQGDLNVDNHKESE